MTRFTLVIEVITSREQYGDRPLAFGQEEEEHHAKMAFEYTLMYFLASNPNVPKLVPSLST